MEGKKLKCEICDMEIEGEPFAVSNLSEPPRILKVCERCAGGEVSIYHDGVQVTVALDDYLQADKERLYSAIESAANSLEDHGWSLDGIELMADSDLTQEPID